MAMFPIFMIGVVVGITLSYAFYKYKEDVPSTVKIEMQERQLKQQDNENKMLEDLNKKLYDKIDKLERELHELKNK